MLGQLSDSNRPARTRTIMSEIQQATMKATLPGLLLVDDDPLIRDTLGFVLADDYEIRTAANREEAVMLASSVGFRPALALVDLGLPPRPHQPDDGFRLIVELQALVPELKIVVLSGQQAEQHARHARTLGAMDFVAKPASPAVIREALRCAINGRDADASLNAAMQVHGLIGASPSMERLRRQIHQFAGAPFPVLVMGESGSGKEAVARALHTQSPRASAPYLALNCAALAESLIEATLFGHAKGAFTGAATARAGYFEEVGEGTLFLDEIGELPLGLQAKLLRVLENGEYQRLGETQPRHSRARIVAASNRDLRLMARSNTFRLDLFHRLSVLAIETPPLRELGEDRWLLLEHFLAQYSQQLQVTPCRLDASARACWNRYAFPGNVRELRNIVIRLLTKHAGQQIDGSTLEAELDVEAPQPAAESALPFATALATLRDATDFDLDRVLASWEKAYIDAALQLAAGNMSQAARLLGINRTTLYSRMDNLGQRAHSTGSKPGTPKHVP